MLYTLLSFILRGQVSPLSTLQIKKLMLQRSSDLSKDTQWSIGVELGYEIRPVWRQGLFFLYLPTGPKSDNNINTQATAQGSEVQRQVLPPTSEVSSWEEKGRHVTVSALSTICVPRKQWQEWCRVAASDHCRPQTGLRFPGSQEVVLKLQVNSRASWSSFPLNLRPHTLHVNVIF